MFGLRDEAEGITFEPVESPLEQAERWVSWAASAAHDTASSWSGNSDNTRYNLNQFWSLKSEHYDEDPQAWDELDLRAHKAWAALAELGMVKDNPPAQKRYQDEAQTAYAGAIAAAERLGKPTDVLRINAGGSGEWFSTVKSLGNSIDDRMSVAVMDRVDQLLDEAASLLGVPLWAWGLGAIGIAWILWGRK